MMTNNYDLSFRKNKVDYLLAITAMLQPVLTLVQFFLMDAMRMDPVTANRLRVMTTAVPIVLSMFFVIHRKPLLTGVTYFIVLMILFITLVIFPGRWKFMSDDVLKFTLPVVIPTGLCIASIKNLPVLSRCMTIISILAALVSTLYAIAFMSGGFLIEGYSIAFSYALLFPTFVLLTKEAMFCKFIATFLMIEMLAIGSRGALVVSIAYWFLSFMFINRSKRRLFIFIPMLLLVIVFFNPIVNLLADMFDAIGISSRTLRLLSRNELITHDSGRSDLQNQVWHYINERPILGSGVWADRVFLGTYSHNVILELLLDFGYLGSGIILLVLLYKQIRIFCRIPHNHKVVYFMMLSLLIPLFVSSSYLISFSTGMFLGFSYLISEMRDKKVYQDFKFR